MTNLNDLSFSYFTVFLAFFDFLFTNLLQYLFRTIFSLLLRSAELEQSAPSSCIWHETYERTLFWLFFSLHNITASADSFKYTALNHRYPRRHFLWRSQKAGHSCYPTKLLLKLVYLLSQWLGVLAALNKNRWQHMLRWEMYLIWVILYQYTNLLVLSRNHLSMC